MACFSFCVVVFLSSHWALPSMSPSIYTSLLCFDNPASHLYAQYFSLPCRNTTKSWADNQEGTEGKQQTGQSVLWWASKVGREHRQESSVSVLLPSPLCVVFWYYSIFIRNACLCGTQLHLCFVITLLFKRRDEKGHVGERKISKAKHTEVGLGSNVFLQSF